MRPYGLRKTKTYGWGDRTSRRTSSPRIVVTPRVDSSKVGRRLDPADRADLDDA